jgi:hypothetical protein
MQSYQNTYFFLESVQKSVKVLRILSLNQHIQKQHDTWAFKTADLSHDILPHTEYLHIHVFYKFNANKCMAY